MENITEELKKLISYTRTMINELDNKIFNDKSQLNLSFNQIKKEIETTEEIRINEIKNEIILLINDEIKKCAKNLFINDDICFRICYRHKNTSLHYTIRDSKKIFKLLKEHFEENGFKLNMETSNGYIVYLLSEINNNQIESELNQSELDQNGLSAEEHYYNLTIYQRFIWFIKSIFYLFTKNKILPLPKHPYR